MADTDPISLKGKRVLLTGGTTGVGRATLLALVREGARVVTFGRHEAELKAALDLADETGAGGTGAEVHGLTADVATREGVAAVFKEVDDKLGGIDILITCAALGALPLHELSDDEWRYVVETNLVGTIACAKASIDRMLRQGHGHLLFVGSISAEIKAWGESVYTATKAGLQAFAEALRKEMGDKFIKVGVIQPGTTSSDMQEADLATQHSEVDAQRMLRAERVTEAIIFALTRPDDADVVTLRIEPRLQKTA